jgi:hypothetical protein
MVGGVEEFAEAVVTDAEIGGDRLKGTLHSFGVEDVE